jgi:hypothetical protein
MGKHKLTKFTITWTQGKPTPSPSYYSMCLTMGPTSKCHFVLGLSNGSPEIFKIETPVILEAHNFVCITLIEVRFKAKL